MNKNYRWRTSIVKTFVVFAISSLIYFGLLTRVDRPILAQSDLTLKSDIISLRARLNRLEQEVNNLRSSKAGSRNSVPTQQPPAQQNSGNPPVIDGQFIGSSDPMFKRLATLLIELKEDVRNIDKRLTKVEEASE